MSGEREGLDLTERLALFDEAPCGFHSTNELGIVLDVNDTWLRMTGYRRDEVIGKLSITALLGAEQTRQLQQMLPEAIARGGLRDLELDLRRRDGTTFTALVNSSFVVEGGRLIRTRSVILDISARKQIEAQFRAIIEGAPDGVVAVDWQGRITLVNRQIEQLFQYTREELVGKPIEMLVPEPARRRHAELRSGFIAAPGVRTMGQGRELAGRRRDGSEVPIEIGLSPMPGREGHITLAAVRDITERRQAERALALLKDRLENAVESFQDAFAIFDAEDRLVLCNSAFRRSLPEGLAGPVQGVAYAELFDAMLTHGLFDTAGLSADAFREKRLAYRKAPHGAFDVRTADGHSWRMIDRRTHEGGTVTTIWDLSEDMRRERELFVAKQAAESASAAKSEFLSSMSHELRTPLNAVLGFAQLLLRDRRTPLSERQQGMVHHIIKGGELLLRLIDEVLDLARIESGYTPISPEAVSLSLVMKEVVATLSPMAQSAGATLVAPEIPDNLPPVLVDRTRCAQILMNFGSNAIKYGRPGGHVSFSIERVDGRVRVTVSDDGMGIPLDRQDRIFQPFYRAGQETGTIEGTGIGLAITRRIAEMMNGVVGFKSTPGQGSDFWVELPEALEQVRPPTPSTAPSALEGPLSMRGQPAYEVLYVEDNPSNLVLMEELMALFDRVKLFTAPTAEIGIEIARARRPQLVILDINLPGMSGYEALQRLRAWPETASTPIIALSASAMERDVRRALELGFDRYLTKPIKIDELTQALETFLIKAGPPSSAGK